MSLETKLAGWTGPSSDSEQEKQDRTERMIREAMQGHPGLDGCTLKVYAKGSYANNTNVRSDSDVDIVVQCNDVTYWEEAAPGVHPTSTPYTGIWTPDKLRAELASALRAKFPGHVDTSGSTAIRIESNTARVEADVVPAFNYKYYFASGGHRSGSRVYKKDGTYLTNYPDQQLVNGRAKNTATGARYKKAVRIMKRVENGMVASNHHREVPSFFMECLVYNCPNEVLMRSTWTDIIQGVIVHIWNELQGAEPTETSKRWLEPNEIKYLFHSSQPWTRADGRDFVKAAWNYLGYTS
ncbi:nucleotidyltransferase [Pseudarthrobacter sp. L1SW]|uniref:nucleotidyltransferase domain-containing protein n=1 Tax=Pseudarthrobacter sp. L1SW TaxID=2851598 RepID=UPI001E3CE5A2|nr:nucleotidyltransferase [Pseudarthrobacter sp. L1SW]UEL27983.1 nucleotidyltransferase [Pseudarthrobacter sp. L1SW]